MSAIQEAIRRHIRALLGPDLKSDINRLLLHGPRIRLMDVQRNAVLGSTGRGFAGSVVTPEIPSLVPGAFFGIPYSDSAPGGWGEPLEPPPGTPGGDHPQRIWRSDGGVWALENQLDWEAVLPDGWHSGNVSWTGSGGITISWHWRPLGGTDRSNASKYHLRTEDFIDWAADQQGSFQILQAQICCNGRIVAYMPAFLSNRLPAVIGAAILGDYLLAVGVDVWAYGQGNPSTLDNRTAFGYWQIQPHADGGIELAPGAQFQLLTILREYEWTQIWAWSDDGTHSASLRGNVGDPDGRYAIQRADWSLGPTPSVNITSEIEPTRRNTFSIEGTVDQTKNCQDNDPPDTLTIVYTCVGEYEHPQLGTIYTADLTISGDHLGTGEIGDLVMTHDLMEDSADDRHFIAIDFRGNDEKIVELVFRCTSIIDTHMAGSNSKVTTEDIHTGAPTWDSDASQFRSGGGGGTETLTEYRQLDAWVDGTLSAYFELEVGGEVKAVLGSIDETYNFTWDTENYSRITVDERLAPPAGEIDPTVGSELNTECGPGYRFNTGHFSTGPPISDIETGNPNIPICSSLSFEPDFIRTNMTPSSSGVDVVRKQSKLLFMDVKEDLYIIYTETGDLYPQFHTLDDIEFDTDPGTTNDDAIAVNFKGQDIESAMGTPADIRRKILTGMTGDLIDLDTEIGVSDFFDIQHDIGAAIKGDSMLLAASHPWMVVADGDFTAVKLYGPDADPLTLVPADGENQYIGYVCRVD